MRKILLALAIAGSIALTGCSTTQISDTEAEFVVPTDFAEPTQDAKTSVTFIRDRGFYGGGVRTHISIDDKKIAKLWSSQMTRVFLSRGTHILKMEVNYEDHYQTIDVQDKDMVFRIHMNITSGGSIDRIK